MKKLLPALKRKAFLLLTFIAYYFVQTGYAQTASFTASGTWTCPAGVYIIIVESWGGGGAGGGASINKSAGAGGGGGAYNRTTSIGVIPGFTYNVTVGSGGVGVATGAGGNGSSSYFNINSAIANGGNGGAVNSGTGGTGGAGGLFAGGNGASGGNFGGVGAGGGAAGTASAGGNASGAIAGAGGVTGGGAGGAGFTAFPNSSATGNNGNLPGGGGGGGIKGNPSTSASPGGDGGAGKVNIYWSCPSYNVLSSALTALNTCAGSGSAITVTSLSLGSGNYIITYDVGSPNTATGLTATMNFTAGSPGVGNFTTAALANAGASTITITNLTSGAVTGSPSPTGTLNCTSAITINNTATCTVNPLPTLYTVTGGGPYCSGGSGIALGLVGSQIGVNYQLKVGGINTGGVVAGTGAAISFGNQTAAGIYTVIATNASTNCVSTMTGSVVVSITAAGLNPGTFTIGSTGNFTSITAATAALSSTCTTAGAYLFELQSSYTSAAETLPLSLPTLSWATAVNTITIRPASGVTGLIISSASSAGTLNLNTGNNYIIDGRSGGAGSTKNLSIINTSTSGYVIQFINDAQKNIIRYCTIQGVNSSTTSGNILFSTSATTNGNSNNKIDNCDIKDGATTPLNAVYSNGTATAGRQNISDTISNCNIYNFFSGISDGNGIYMGTGTTDWTITGNSFYETSSRALGSGNTWSAIQLNNTASGNNINITGNFIGGLAAGAASGTMTFTGGGILNAIKIAGFSGTASSIQGNTIRNISFITSSGASPHALIRHLQGNINIGTITGNIIGSQTTNGNISFISSGICEFAGITAGISSTGSSDVINIYNNTIAGIDISGSGNINFAGLKLRGLPGASIINNNVVGSTTTANSISNTTQEESNGILAFVGSTTALQTISNNIIANILMSNASSSANHFYGINAKDNTAGTDGGIYNITGNTVYNLTSASKIVVGDFTTAGISMAATTQGGQTVTKNIIYNLYDSDPTAASGIVGINYAGPVIGTNKVEKNFIHDLSLATSDVTGLSLGTIVGLNINNGITTYSNNIISLGDSSGNPITKSYEIYGIGDFLGEVAAPLGAGYNNYLNNTVYIGGAGVTGGTSRTFAYYNSVPDTRSRTIKNNIFYNARSGTGTHYAMYYPSNVTTVHNLTSDYNDLYVSGTGGKIGYLNSLNYDTITTWRAVTLKDSMSVTDDPLLINPSGTAITKDLHIQTGSICNNEATPVLPVLISTDYGGTLRDLPHGIYPATPDIGAYELSRGTSPGTWLGLVSTDWLNTANWDDGIVPTNAIPTFMARGHNDAAAANYFPVIPSGVTAFSKNITLHLPTTALTVTGTGVIKVAGSIRAGININKGKFSLVDGTLEMNGISGTQNIAGNMFVQTTIKNFITGNNINIANQWAPDTIRITGVTSFDNVNSKTITTNGNLTLVSNATGTASIADMTNNGANSGNSVSGNVIVERYMSAVKAWRFVTFPVSTSSTVKATLMEGCGANANCYGGYGTQVIGNGTGFDVVVSSPSLKYYNAVTNSWIGITNANTQLLSDPALGGDKGYMLFVRGSRSVITSAGAANQTVLRSVGPVKSYTKTVNVTAGITSYTSFGNPYPSQIDLRKLTPAPTAGSIYVVWDPKAATNSVYGFGAYKTLTFDGTNFNVTPYEAASSYGANANYIESGQAFFIQGKASAYTLNFNENSKVGGDYLVQGAIKGGSPEYALINLYTNTGGSASLMDGARIDIGEQYSNVVNEEDARKLGNSYENVSLMRNGYSMSVERHHSLASSDTFVLKTTNLRSQSYSWKLHLNALETQGAKVWLVDKYLASSHSLNLNGLTQIDFTADANTASKASDRFMIVFKKPSPAAVLSAERIKNKYSIKVDWKVIYEAETADYLLERSTDSTNFLPVFNKQAQYNNETTADYTYMDENPSAFDNYYRVKSVSTDGLVQYSNVVKIASLETRSVVKVYPNPVTDKTMQVQFFNMPAGDYGLQLINEIGQLMYSSKVKLTENYSTQAIRLPAAVATGQFGLVIIAANGTRTVQQLIIN